jgi:PAS domain S-box-containing protein
MQANELGLDASAVAARAESRGHSAHLVQFYEGDAFLTETVARFACEGLEGHDAVIVLATPEHRSAIDERLAARGIDIAAARAQGRYVDLDAGRMLAELMVDDWPDEQSFERVIGAAIGQVSAPGRKVRAFGELVAILAAEGRHEAAVRLEALWNGLAARRTFSLLCAYPIGAFGTDFEGTAFHRVCEEHAHVVPAESFTRLGNPSDRFRAVTLLQQKASALVAVTAERHAAQRALRHREQELRESEVRFQNAADHAPLMMWARDASGHCTHLNARWYEFTGETPGTGLGLGWLDVIHPDDRDAACHAFLRATARREAFRLEYRVRRYDGAHRWVIDTATPRLGPDGTFLGHVGSMVDITERKEIEQKLHERSQVLHAIIEGSPVPIVVMDPDRTVRFWNPAAERVFGWTPNDVVGRPLPIVPPEHSAEYASFWDAFGPASSVVGVETQGAMRDGRLIDLVVSAAPLARDDGGVTSMVLLFEDITLRKEAEIQKATLMAVSERAREDAEASSRAKDEFLAMLGHELRNPLAAVRNAVAVARSDSSGRERALEIAHRQIDQLARLVGDLLDIARITQRRIALQRKRVSLAGIVERAVETTRPLVEERAHAISVVLSHDDVQVDGDATRLEQVIVNLVSNAAKYNDPGGTIVVTAARDGDTAVVRVRDEGIGIARDMLPRVFDLFAQAGRGLDRAYGGLGIGLTVVKQLVELHGGTVEARSDGPGFGSEFVVRLPALSVKSVDVSASLPTDVAQVSARVLLVEDNPDAAESLGMLLELLGHRVHAVHDGPGALAAVTAHRPEVMLIDIGLPGMDGYEVARRIRQLPELARVTLIALTGYGRDTDKEQAIAAGFDYHLVKPVDPDALQALVARLTAGANRNGNGAPRSH